MDIELLEKFFFWCLLINLGIYTATALAALMLRDFLITVHSKLFDLDKQTVLTSVHRYLATYKLMVTVFNFTPWLAMLIIQS